ncbi:MAG: MBL fold metallo-hydrolase [Deltaproteobacteria bacterium]|nr:MBL fold metallo-hydrolase [Candidatus Zymogenaceae bacterium]
MLIRIWGARGSTPVSGAEYVEFGGDTTCLEVVANSGDTIILDAGTGIRRLGAEAYQKGKTDFHILFTHGHWDHLFGLPYFKPLHNSSTRLWLYGYRGKEGAVRDLISSLLSPPHFPVDYENITARREYRNGDGSEYRIGTITIRSIPISHPGGGLGYRLTEGDTTMVFLTDNELGYEHPGRATYDEYLEFCRDADLLIHDAEFTPMEYGRVRSWGHSSYADAVDLAADAGVKRLCLWHHNHERSDEGLARIERESRQIALKRESGLLCFAARQDMELSL